MRPRPVEQYNARGERLVVYYNIAQAAEAAGVSYQKMYAVLNGTHRLGRYYFVYFGEKVVSPQQSPYKAMRTKGDEMEGFTSLKEASRLTGIPYKRICALVRDGLKDKDGYTWSRADKW